jgi:hypothetical protein
VESMDTPLQMPEELIFSTVMPEAFYNGRILTPQEAGKPDSYIITRIEVMGGMGGSAAMMMYGVYGRKITKA